MKTKTMKKVIEKYTNKLIVLKENRAITVDENTDADNKLYDQLIKQVAEFIRDLNNLTISVVDNSVYCKCKEPFELRMIPNGTPYCEECGKNIKL